MTPKFQPPTRHVVSINDLSIDEIESIFSLAQEFLDQLGDPDVPYRIGRGTRQSGNSRNVSDHILAAIFYEPSTRTRLSFESAMLRLGGEIITSADPATSSAKKGESLADSVRVIANYADVIVIRHPRDGAARLAAEYSPIPIINGGDGSHEHPTQTLCDIFTLKKKNKSLKKLNVAIAGDLKGSRTIHSFVYALARFGAYIVPKPAPGMELPAHVDRRLREEFHCTFRGGHGSIGAVYQTPNEPHQPALFSEPEFEVRVRSGTREVNVKTGSRVGEKIAAVYVTRYQKERWADKDQQYPKIDANFLKEPKYSKASVLHPLPRVDELDVSLDSDVRAVYFEQAAYGVPVRMALISLLLGLGEKKLERFEGGFRKESLAIYDQPLGIGIQCKNGNCIVLDEIEAPYVRNKFHIVKGTSVPKLRCIYCETDIDQFVVANKKNKWFTNDTDALVKIPHHSLKEYIVFADETEAITAGYHFKGQHSSRKLSRQKIARSNT
jgi:aspartate carbamoyltransferase catalytic subunit